MLETPFPRLTLTDVPSSNVRLAPRYSNDVGSAVPAQEAKHEPAPRTPERIAEVLQQMRRAFPENTEKELLEMIEEL